jgi:acetylornithine deacetylase
MFIMKLFNLLTGVFLSSWTVIAYSTSPQSPLITSSKPNADLLSLHKSLVEHSSITYNEHSVDHFLTTYLRRQNFTVETQPVAAPSGTQSNHARHNVLAYTGKTRQTRTLVTSHIDTVPPFWPYERRGAEIWGRGSVDAKGSVATQIKAIESLVSSGAIGEGDVAMLFVVGEETGGDGMRAANELGLAWETVIFGEPTELKLASGHKGTVGVRIRAKGKAGHSGYPELGRNANSMLVKALYALDRLELPWSEKYGNTTLNIGVMEGGVAQNVIAEEAEAQLQIRIADGEPAVVEGVILDALENVGEELDVTFTPGYGPVDIDHDVEGELLKP